MICFEARQRDKGELLLRQFNGGGVVLTLTLTHSRNLMPWEVWEIRWGEPHTLEAAYRTGCPFFFFQRIIQSTVMRSAVTWPAICIITVFPLASN